MRAPIGWASRFSVNVWLLLANTFFVFTGLGIFVLIYNLYLASLGYREDYIGLFSFASTAAIGGSAIPAGYLSNRIGPRACLAIASLVMGLVTVAASMATDPVLIVVVGALYGVSNALIFVPGGPFLMDNSGEDERLQVFSASFAANAAASVLGSLVSGYLPGVLSAALGLGSAESTASYRLTLLASGAICLLGAVPMLLARPARRRPPRAPGTSPVAPLSQTAARRVLLILIGAVGLTAIATGLILPFFNVYFAEQLAASVEQIGVIYAVGSLVMVPASLAGPALSRRLGRVGTIVLFRLATAPFLLCLPLAPSLGTGALAYVARAGLMSVTWPLDNAFVMELMPPRLRAMQAGVRSASWNVGWAVASLIAGQIIVDFGYAAVFVASGMFTLAGAVYYLAAFRRHEARQIGAERAPA